MPSGRLTNLTPELIEQARGYLATCIGKVPSVEGLALYLRVSRRSIYYWAEAGEQENASPESQAFLHIYEEMICERAERLQQGGLYNRFNPTITKLLLSKHGYVEKQETDLTTKGKELPAPILGGASVPDHNSDQEAAGA